MIQSRLERIEKKENIHFIDSISSLNFTVKIASEYEKNKIMNIMISEYRQTMNIRLMPTAKLILLKDESRGNEIIGWFGLDYQYNVDFPETFSLYIMPDYRSLHLSLVLKHAAYSILSENGITKSYTRMEASHNQRLIQHNINTGFYRILHSSEINAAWKAMCSHCELYKKNCKSQMYLEVDVSRMINSLNAKLGKLPDLNFPKSIELIKRKKIKNKSYTDLLIPKWLF